MKKSIVYVFVFAAIQILVMTVVTQLWKWMAGSSGVTGPMLIVSTVASSLLTMVVFLWSRWTEVSRRYLLTRPLAVVLWSVVAGVGVIIPSTWLQEVMPELPDLAGNELGQIMGEHFGYLAIGILAPLSEEIVFRGAILRALLRQWEQRPWLAIAVSAVLFALIHFNPAQMPHALLMGLLMGWMYWRTGSILPSVVFHCTNNTFAYLIYIVYPDPDVRLSDIFQGSLLHVYMAVGFSLLILIPAIFQLHLWMKRPE